MSFWKDAFAMERAEDFAPTERERELIAAVAARICRHGLAMPAILFLETSRPLNFVGSQALAFFEPLIRGMFDWPSYTEFARLLERRGSIEAIIRSIEETESEQQRLARQQNRPGFWHRLRRRSTTTKAKTDEH